MRLFIICATFYELGLTILSAAAAAFRCFRGIARLSRLAKLGRGRTHDALYASWRSRLRGCILSARSLSLSAIIPRVLVVSGEAQSRPRSFFCARLVVLPSPAPALGVLGDPRQGLLFSKSARIHSASRLTPSSHTLHSDSTSTSNAQTHGRPSPNDIGVRLDSAESRHYCRLRLPVDLCDLRRILPPSQVSP